MGNPTKRRWIPFLIVTAIIVCIAWMVLSSSTSPKPKNSSTDANQTEPSMDQPAGEAKSEAKTEDYPDVLASGPPPAGSLQMVTKGVGVVPGAILCPSYNTVQTMFHMYSEPWGEKAQDAVTHGESELIRGKAMEPPFLKEYNCAFLPQGTPVMQEQGNIVPVIRVQSNGSWYRGVTLAGMTMTKDQADKIARGQATYEQFVKSLRDLKPDFERQFQSLRAPAPNRRWYQGGNGSALVSLFGPCAVLRQGDGGFIVTEFDRGGLSFFGPFQSEQDGESNAESVCASQFAVEATRQHTATDLWFPVEQARSQPQAQ